MGLIHERMGEIMSEVQVIRKNRKNQSQGYVYRSIDDTYNALHDIFAKHQVFMSKKILNSFREERPTKSGGVNIYSIIDYEISFTTVDGSNFTTQERGEAMDNGDKSSNKSASAALKYALMHVFLIPTEGDNDADAHSVEAAPKARESLISDLVAIKNAKDFNDFLTKKEYWKDNRNVTEGRLIAARVKELKLKLNEQTKQYENE